MVLSHLSYCNIVWGNCSFYLLNRLFLLQKRAVRAITKSHYLAHTHDLFLKLKILNVYDINKLQTACFMYSYFKKLLPPLFDGYFKYNRDVNVYKTRNSHKIYTPFCKYKFSRSIISYQGAIVWNDLPDELEQCPTLGNFKRKYKGLLNYTLLQ